MGGRGVEPRGEGDLGIPPWPTIPSAQGGEVDRQTLPGYIFAPSEGSSTLPDLYFVVGRSVTN